MPLIDRAKAMQGDLVELRRSIHRQPEIGLMLPVTQQHVLDEVQDLPLEVSTGSRLSSVVAVLRGDRSSGRSVLLRADMDALPVKEETGLEFAAPSSAMHACGHDLHTAMLVGAARLLSEERERLAGDVVLVFQPGEEGHDGARIMLEEGLLNASGSPLDAAFALHVESAKMQRGLVVTRPGPMMAAVDTLRVTVRGAGGHGSMPHRASDPIPAAAEMVTALQTFVTRHFDVFDPVVITVAVFHAGTKPTVIPDDAHFEATVRSFSPQSHARVAEESVRLCRQIGTAHGLHVDAEYEVLHPATVNASAHADFALAAAAELLGSERSAVLASPISASDDFSLVLESVPGAMIFLGACPSGADPDTAPFNHSPRAVFDEDVLSDGAALFAALALGWLARQPS